MKMFQVSEDEDGADTFTGKAVTDLLRRSAGHRWFGRFFGDEFIIPRSWACCPVCERKRPENNP